MAVCSYVERRRQTYYSGRGCRARWRRFWAGPMFVGSLLTTEAQAAL